ncbi:MAG: DUF4245 domain-containing protein [Candidatus Nanopelagicales bacterium]
MPPVAHNGRRERRPRHRCAGARRAGRRPCRRADGRGRRSVRGDGVRRGRGGGRRGRARRSGTAAAAVERAERERKRLRQTVRDMILSMAVVAGVVLLLFQPWGRSTPDPVRTVDPTPVVSTARETADWPVLAPTGQPATWRATSARFEVAADGESVLQTGYLSPSTKYVGLAQSRTKETAFVRDRSGEGEPAGTATLGGVTWDRLETPDGKQRSLVRVDDGVTYVVTGQADWPEIEAFAASLTAG